MITAKRVGTVCISCRVCDGDAGAATSEYRCIKIAGDRQMCLQRYKLSLLDTGAFMPSAHDGRGRRKLQKEESRVFNPVHMY